MLPETARKIFNSLYGALKETNFEGIGTFLLARENNNQNDNIFYEDSVTALEELYLRAQNLQNSESSLRQLVLATHEYFTTARQLVNSYKRETENFQTDKENPAPGLKVFFDEIEQEVDISKVLETESLDRFLYLIMMVIEFSGNDDDSFFQKLNDVYK